jgi:hypothetical protein
MKGASRLLLSLAVMLVLLLVGSSASANPDLRWRTIETEHFYVHYHAGEEEAANRVAMVAERAYERLSVAYGHRVFLKIHVTLTDPTDSANGRATASPYPFMVAYATAPEALSVLEAYDDWIDILITHELVHVVHLDTVHGIPRLINAVLGFGVLGKVTQPNVVQPRWVVEGIATMDESEFSSQGRRRSAQFDAYIRMAVLEGQFQAIDQVSSISRIWPHGTSVYLYGVHFMYYIAARYGRDKLRELSHLYGGQVVPFGINRAIERVLGVSFYELWDEFRDDTVRRFTAQARRIRQRGLRQGRRLTFSGETTRYPFWAPDDAWIYFYKDDQHAVRSLRGDEGIKRIRPEGGRMREGRGIGRQGVDVDVEHVIDVEDPGEASFVGATEDIVFDMTAVYDFRYRWSDLYRWNGGDPMEHEQLTFGLRASEPHVAADGRTAVFRRNDITQSRLGFIDLATGDVTEVAPLERLAQVYTPRFAPDGHRVAFSGWREGGYRDIYVYDRRTGVTERITAGRHMDLSPTWSPDGRFVLFSSDRDDVFNIHAYDTETGRLHQVSNVLGGAFEPAVSHDGEQIAYIGLSSSGFDLWVMDFDPERWLAVMPSVDDLPLAEDPEPALPEHDGRPPALASKRYQAGKTMFPRTIFPAALDFQNVGAGTALGFETGVSDHLGFHTLLWNFNYFLQERIDTTSVSYTYRRLFPTFSIGFARGFTHRGGFTRFLYDRPEGVEDAYVIQSAYRERSHSVNSNVSLPVVRHPRHSVDASFGYRWTRWTNLDEDQVVVDPNAPIVGLPTVGDAGQVEGRVAYSNLADGTGRFTYGSEKGRAAAVRVVLVDEHLGGDFGDVQVTANYREIIPMPWRGHQSLSLEARGGASAGGFRTRLPFCVGDFVSSTDAIRQLLAREVSGAAGCSLLRGYPAFGDPGGGIIQGQYFTVLSADYRIPIVDIDRGLGSLPMFLQRIGLIPFVDWGNAWRSEVSLADFLWGAGAALVITFRLGYLDQVSLFLQYAHGFDPDQGVDSFRAVISTAF